MKGSFLTINKPFEIINVFFFFLTLMYVAPSIHVNKLQTTLKNVYSVDFVKH